MELSVYHTKSLHLSYDAKLRSEHKIYLAAYSGSISSPINTYKAKPFINLKLTWNIPEHWSSWLWGNCPCYVHIITIQTVYLGNWHKENLSWWFVIKLCLFDAWISQYCLQYLHTVGVKIICNYSQPALVFMNMFLSGRCISWEAERMCISSCITIPCQEKYCNWLKTKKMYLNQLKGGF